MQLTVDEQEALARAAQRLGEAASQGRPVDARTQLDLFGMANQVANPHGVPLRAGEPLPVIRELTYVVYPDPESGAYPLPVAELWKLPNVVGEPAVDLVVDFGDPARHHRAWAPGGCAHGLVQLNPIALPDWLAR